MKTYYYLATVSNATSCAVRVQIATEAPFEAMALALTQLANLRFYVTSVQELTAGQYFAPNVAPVCYDVQTRPVDMVG